MDWLSISVREHQRLDAIESVAAMLEIFSMVLGENLESAVVERDHPTASVALWFADHRLVPCLNDRLDYAKLTLFEVDVSPAQPKHFATAHACRSGEEVSGEEAVTPRRAKEVPKLGSRPRRTYMGT